MGCHARLNRANYRINGSLMKDGRLGSANLLASVTEGIMKNEKVREALNTSLLYLAGNLNASALCFLAFMIAYKLHIHFGFPQPSLDGLSFVLVVCTLYFKVRIEKELKESGIPVKDALPKIASRAICGVLALALVLNADVIINSMIWFNNWFLNEFSPK